MATVRLEFELDSEVYPELYAALSGMRNTRARAERLRQLAAAGLVWENVRIHGASAIGPTPNEHPPPAPRSERERTAPPERRNSTRVRSVREPPVADARGAGFIDLAIDAVPAPEPPVRERLVARELPVLMDVVMNVVAEQTLSDEAAATGDSGATVTMPDAAIHLASLAEKPATRSRLMRMKDKGLFKNG